MEKIQMTINVSAQTAMKIAEILASECNTAKPNVSQAQNIPVSSPVVQSVIPIQTAPVAQPQTYTIEQIQTACAPLMDAGKQQELIGLLAQFGVQALPQLPKEQYGAFATALRGLGAKI